VTIHELPDLAKVRRIEAAAARNLLDYVHAAGSAGFEAAAAPCGGGVAAYLGPGSPLTVVKGGGPEIADRDIDDAECFFRECGVDSVVFELAPWISQDSLARFVMRGYLQTGLEDVVVRDAPWEAPAARHTIVEVTPEDWPELMLEINENTSGRFWRLLAKSSALLPGAILLAVSGGERRISCAQLAPAGEVAPFANDATHSSARGGGAQIDLIRHRLGIAAARGFLRVAAEVAPECSSERNYQRCGFQRLYARTHWARKLR
jgi:hypothetical protein